MFYGDAWTFFGSEAPPGRAHLCEIGNGCILARGGLAHLSVLSSQVLPFFFSDTPGCRSVHCLEFFVFVATRTRLKRSFFLARLIVKSHTHGCDRTIIPYESLDTVLAWTRRPILLASKFFSLTRAESIKWGFILQLHEILTVLTRAGIHLKLFTPVD